MERYGLIQYLIQRLYNTKIKSLLLKAIIQIKFNNKIFHPFQQQKISNINYFANLSKNRLILKTLSIFKNQFMQEGLQEQPFELQKGSTLVHQKYKVIGKLGNSSFSTVHSITMSKGKKQIIRAAKVEAISVKEPQINTEVSVLKHIKESNPDQIGFPRIYQYGSEADFHYLIMTILGPNLEQLLKLCGGLFSLKTTIIVALQILDRLEVLHNYGYTYGDIKPSNFVIGLGSQSPFVFIIDFGKCKRFKNRLTNQHLVYKQNVFYSFDPIFGSINAHNHIQTSRRDDIQSLVYLVVYLKMGKLPWAKQNDNKRSNVQITAEELKKRVTPQMLCHKMPLQIIDLMYYVRSIQFYQKPDYDFIRKLFYRCLERQNMDSNIAYDWNKLQEVDFKVYSGEPRILLKINNINKNIDKFSELTEQRQKQYSNSDDDQNSKLIEQ